MAVSTVEAHALARFWKRYLRLAALLTTAWVFAALFAPVFLGSAMRSFFGFPLSTWLLVQTAPIVFVAIAWLHARRVDDLDSDYMSDSQDR